MSTAGLSEKQCNVLNWLAKAERTPTRRRSRRRRLGESRYADRRGVAALDAFAMMRTCLHPSPHAAAIRVEFGAKPSPAIPLLWPDDEHPHGEQHRHEQQHGPPRIHEQREPAGQQR